jgi:adenine-specific DNA-methyltransferase
MTTTLNYESLSRDDLMRILMERDAEEQGALRLHYYGQTPPWQIVRRVRPRCQKIEPTLSFGSEAEQASNLVIEGDNLQTMVSLYKYRGQVDLILTDPPYNTGNDFRYNDKWDVDPNDTDLGRLVPSDDGSRHSKWLRLMVPRLWMMREMLRPDGVLAVCIDHRELYRLGMVLDDIFGEDNRIAIINWQKSYAPKNNVGKRAHVSTSTEYVLVYAKNIDRAKTTLLPRSEEMNARYLSPDGDPRLWKPGDLTGPGADTHRPQVYGIQNPFTGEIVYPTAGRCWAAERRRVKQLLEAYKIKYRNRRLDDGCADALVIEGDLADAKVTAERIRDCEVWPVGHWRDGGQGTFGVKKYLEDVKKGIVPMTFWADEEYDEPLVLGSTSWEHEESGHSQSGINELTAIVGPGHGFETVKPLKLFKKIIQIWCRPEGIILDPFAGSGTTAHAVLDLNKRSGATRRFVLIEQGRPERGDSYARTLTVERLKRAIMGQRVDKSGKLGLMTEPLPGGFRFSKLTARVDGSAVLSLQREEMLDLLVTSHWDQSERAGSHLRRLPATAQGHLFARNSRNEGYFLVWSGPDQPSVLNRAVFRAIAEEAKAEGLTTPFHVYARTSVYPGPNIQFYQIPDRILEKLGFNEATQPYSQREDAVA